MNKTYDITYSCPRRIWLREGLVDAMLEDLLHGQTFRVLHSRQETVRLCSRSFRDHVHEQNESNGRQWFSIRVPARHFSSGRLSAYLVQLWGNVLDYHGMRLEKLDPNLVHEMRPKRKQHVADTFSCHRNPLFATVLKPSWALSLEGRMNMSKEFVSLGGDLVKEDETYTPSLSQLTSDISAIQSALDELQSDHRGLGVYVPNITGWITNATAMRQLCNAGMRAGMIAFFAAGLDAVRDLASTQVDECFLWGHRVGYESMSKTLSATAMAQLAFAAGLDGVHVGTPILRHVSEVEETAHAVDTLRSLSLHEEEVVFPIFSKTTRPILRELLEHYGRQSILIGCGEFHKKGHPAWDQDKVLAWLREGREQEGGSRSHER